LKYLLLFLIPLFHFSTFTFSQGTWNPAGADTTFPRTLLDTTQIDTIRNSLSDPEIYELYQLVWDKANSDVPAGNSTDGERITRALIAKEAAFVVLMNRKPSNGNIIPLTPSESQQLTTKSRQLLEEINAAVGFQSGWIFYQEWQHRSKELINYLIAYDLLMGQDTTSNSLQVAKDSLIGFTAHLYYRAMATYTVFIWQFKFFEFQFNNHSIMTASALGLAAIIFNDYENPDPDYQPQNWIDAGLWNLDNTLFRENGIYPRCSEPDTLAGYAEGPGYFEYGFENAFPFIRAFWNFLPDGFYPMTFNSVTRDIQNPWYDPNYYNLYEWMNLIRMPDGSSPAIHDSPIGFGTSITALSGKSRFNIPNPSYPPTDAMWRSQYIATNVPEGYFSDTLFRALPEAGSLIFRSSHEPDAVYMHFIGKHGIPLSGAKAHHQGDAGSFSIMANSELLAVDPGYPGYQESAAVNQASNHSVVLVNGSGPLPPIGEAVSIGTNTCWIENFFDTPLLDYGEVRTAYFGADIVRKNLFVRNRYFILSDFLSSPNPNTYTFQLQGNGLIGGTPGTPEGVFTPDFTNHQGIYSRDSTQLLVHTIATDGADNYANALDSLATGTSQYSHYSKMLVRKESVENTQFLSVLFPFEQTEPDIVTLQTQPGINAVTIEESFYQDLIFTQEDSSLVEIPASISGLDDNIKGNGNMNFISFENSSFQSLYLEHGDSLFIGDLIYVKADNKIDIAYQYTTNMLHQGYVSDSGWVGFRTACPFYFWPTSGNILLVTHDWENSLLLLLFGGPSYFTLEFAEGAGDHLLSIDKDEILIKKLGYGNYELTLNRDHAGSGTISIYSISGQEVLKRKIHLNNGSNSYRFDLSRFADGLYMVSIITDTQSFSTKLIHH